MKKLMNNKNKVMPSMETLNDFSAKNHEPSEYDYILQKYYKMPMCDCGCGKRMKAMKIEFEDGNTFNLENITNMCTLTYAKDIRQKILCIENSDNRMLMINKDGDMTLLSK